MMDRDSTWPRRVGLGFASAGMAIVLVSTFLVVEWDLTGTRWLLTVGGGGFLAAWGTLPYWIIRSGRAFKSSPWAIGGAGAGALAADIGWRAHVSLWAEGPTAMIVLFYSPILIMLVFFPIGAALGWSVGWLWRFRSHTLRAAVVAVSTMVWGLTVFGLARPDLFPTAVFSREQARTRLGEPGVVAGSEAFEKVLVDQSIWPPGYHAADLDGSPGDEVVVFRHSQVRALDPVDFEIRETFPLVRWPDGQRVSWLAWRSMPARIDGRVLLVQERRGSDTPGIRGLEGELVWAYRPDRPATGLRPADLDGDGMVELYGWGFAVERLDGGGRPVWSHDAAVDGMVLAPRTHTEPGWVVGHGSRGWASVWDENGHLLAELEQLGEDRPVAVVERPSGRGLLLSGSAARVVSIEGDDLFRFALEGLEVRAGLSVRFRATGDPHLVVVAGAPRDVERWRLLVWGAGQEPVYDEVFDGDRPPEVFRAQLGNGSETLFVWRHAPDADLHALRPLVNGV